MPAKRDELEVEPTLGFEPGGPTGDIERVCRVIARLVAGGTAIAAKDASIHKLFPVAVTPSEGESIREWVIRERATRTIEIGLGYGISTLFICEGLLHTAGREAHHVAVDLHQSTRFANCGVQFLGEAGVAELVEFHEEDSHLALPRFLSEGRIFDLACRRNHRFDGAFVDLAYLARLIRPGGVVFLDDYQLPAIRRAVSFWQRNVGWEVEEVSQSDSDHQWAVVRTPRTRDSRPHYHFLDF